MSVRAVRVVSFEPARAGLWLTLLVGAGLRTMGLRAQLWGDETITLRIVERYGLPELLVQVARTQPHYPTYYALLELWSFIAPVSAAKLISIAAGIVTIWAIYELGVTWDGEATGAMAGMLVAVSPVLVTQSTWLRMYALVTAFATLSWLCLARGRYWHAGACTLAAIYLHPFGLLLGLAQLTWLGTEHGATRTLQRTAPALAASLPAVVYLTGKLAVQEASGAVPQVNHLAGPPEVLEVALVPGALLVGRIGAAIQTAGVLAIALSALNAIRHIDEPATRAAVYWLAIPIVATAVASLYHPVFQLKYFGFVAPAVAYLVARGLRPLPVYASAPVFTGLIALQLIILQHALQHSIPIARHVIS